MGLGATRRVISKHTHQSTDCVPVVVRAGQPLAGPLTRLRARTPSPHAAALSCGNTLPYPRAGPAEASFSLALDSATRSAMMSGGFKATLMLPGVRDPVGIEGRASLAIGAANGVSAGLMARTTSPITFIDFPWLEFTFLDFEGAVSFAPQVVNRLKLEGGVVFLGVTARALFEVGAEQFKRSSDRCKPISSRASSEPEQSPPAPCQASAILLLSPPQLARDAPCLAPPRAQSIPATCPQQRLHVLFPLPLPVSNRNAMVSQTCRHSLRPCGS